MSGDPSATAGDPAPAPPDAAAAATSPSTPGRLSWADALRFAFGTLTVLPVRLTRWDRGAARGGMLCAPLAGLVVGGCAAVPAVGLLAAGAGAPLAAVASVAVPAVLTRGLHLDGLADTADGLGSGKPADAALRVMKQSDIGPFGVLTLVLVLLAQVAAAERLFAHGWARGALAVVLSATVARCALTLASRRGVPAARPEGLGAAVAGTVPPVAAGAVAAAVVALAALAGAPAGLSGALHAAAAVLAGLGAAALLLRRCRARLGGVTGDVFGALAETAGVVTAVALALG